MDYLERWLLCSDLYWVPSRPCCGWAAAAYDEDFGFHSFVFELKCYFESFDSHGGLCDVMCSVELRCIRYIA